MTVRRRAVVAVLLGALIGWLFVDIAWRLVGVMLFRFRGSDPSSVGCGGSGLSRVVGVFNGCNSLSYRVGYAPVELVIAIVVVAVLTYWLARWVTLPLGQMTESIDQLGPTNLGLRLRQRGSNREQTKRLADAVDRMLDRVAEGYESQRRFAANASHELRTPLATQRALIEVSLSAALKPDQLDLLSRQLLATNERNERLIDGLLTLAETERGLGATTMLHLDDLVTTVAESMRPYAAERDVGIELHVEPATMTGEQALVERLVTNLVQNAIKYNVAGGHVLVAVTPQSLQVCNTGPLVPADQVAGLFEPFRRLSGERLDHGGGAGLGLTIARSIVAAHDGTIEARPNPHGGLTVEVTLPR